MATVGTAELEFRARVAQFQRDMNAAASSFRDSTESMKAQGRTLRNRVTLPILGIGVAGVKMSADFESSMTKIVGLVGVAREEVNAWAPDVRRMAGSLGISANDAADALFFVTSAGLRGSEAMGVLEASLKASAVGLGDTSTIADLATSAVNAYGSAVIDGAQATDVLTAAVREGKLEAPALAGSMGRVLPIASAMGVQFHEVGAAMAAMSRTGTDAATAATQLRAIMTSLLNPTKDAEDALKGMELSSRGLRQQVRDQGLLSVLETLAEKFRENEDATTKVFGNVRALSGVLDLMGANAAGTREIFEAMVDTTGALDRALSETSKDALFAFQSAWTEMKIAVMEVGDVLLPTAARVARAVESMFRGFSDLPHPVKVATVAVAGLVAAVGPLMIAIATLGPLIARLVAPTFSWAAALGAATIQARSLTAALRVLKVAIGPVGWVLLGVSAIATALTVWGGRQRAVNDELSEAASRLDTYSAALANWTQQAREAEAFRLGEALIRQEAELAELQDRREALQGQMETRAPGRAGQAEAFAERSAQVAAQRELNDEIRIQEALVGRLREDYETVTTAMREGARLAAEMDPPGPPVDLYRATTDELIRMVELGLPMKGLWVELERRMEAARRISRDETRSATERIEKAEEFLDIQNVLAERVLPRIQRVSMSALNVWGDMPRVIRRVTAQWSEVERQLSSGRQVEMRQAQQLLDIYAEHGNNRKALEEAVRAHNRELLIQRVIVEEIRQGNQASIEELRVLAEAYADVVLRAQELENAGQSGAGAFEGAWLAAVQAVGASLGGLASQAANVIGAFAAGGPGAGLAALFGFGVGSFLGGGERSPENERLAREAERAADALARMVDQLRVITDLERQREEALKALEDVIQPGDVFGGAAHNITLLPHVILQMVEAGASYDEILARINATLGLSANKQELFTQALEDYFLMLERLEEQRLRDVAAMQDDIAVRMLVAEGRDDEAEALRMELQFLEEVERARALESDALLEQLDALHELERARLAQAQADREAAQAAREAVEARQFGLNLERMLLEAGAGVAVGLPGQDAAARRIHELDLQADVERRLAGAQDLLDRGVIDEAAFGAFRAALLDLANVSLREFDEAVRAATEAEEHRRIAAEADQEIRLLLAQGMQKEADLRRLEEAHRRRMAETMTDEQRAREELIHELNREEILRRHAVQEAEEVARRTLDPSRVARAVVQSVIGVTEMSARGLIDLARSQLTVQLQLLVAVQGIERRMGASFLANSLGTQMGGGGGSPTVVQTGTTIERVIIEVDAHPGVDGAAVGKAAARQFSRVLAGDMGTGRQYSGRSQRSARR